MTHRITGMDATWLEACPDHLRECLCFVLPPAGAGPPDQVSRRERRREWHETVELEWGTCGQVALADDVVVGCVVYAPATYLPGIAAYPTAPPSPDAVLMAGLLVTDDHGGRGLGRALVRAAARDLLDRYGVDGAVRALEVVSTTRPDEDPCITPAAFCTAVGFEERRAHPRHPRMRLDLRACVSWRAEVGWAWDRIRAGVRVPRPAPVQQPGVQPALAPLPDALRRDAVLRDAPRARDARVPDPR